MAQINVTVRPAPFAPKYQERCPAGSNIADIVRDLPELETREHDDLLVRVNECPRDGIPSMMFDRVFPRTGRFNVVTVQPREGLGDEEIGLGGSLIKGAAGFALGPIVGPLAGIVGATFLENFRKKPKRNRPGAGPGDETFNNAGASVNALQLLEPVPEVFGVHKVFPPAVNQWVEHRGKDVFSNVLCALEGEVTWTDIRVGGTPIADIEGATVSTLNGADGDTNIQFESADLPTAVTEVLGIELPRWDTDPGGLNAWATLVDQSDPTASRPDYTNAKAKTGADEIWLTFTVPDATVQSGKTTVGTSLVIEMRERGASTWRVLPYIALFSAGRTSAFRFTIRLIFSADVGTPALTGDEPFDSAYESWNVTTTGDSANSDHQADAYFTGSGIDAAKPSDHVDQELDHLKIYLDPADGSNPWAVGEWEIRVRAGFAHGDKIAKTATRNYDQTNAAAFPNRRLQASSGADVNQSNQNFNIVWESITSYITGTYPVAATNVAQVFVRIPNRAVTEISAVASRKLKTWNGVQWTGSTITSNPAAILRHIWNDPKLAFPFPDGALNDQELGDFYDHCVTKGLQFNSLIDSGTVHDWAQRVTRLAKAKTKQGQLYGAWWDVDRSAEAPVITVSAHTGSGFTLLSPREPAPHAYNVTYFDSADEYRQTDRLVYRSGFNASNAVDIRNFDGEGLVTSAQVDDVVGYLLDEFAARSTLVQCTVSSDGRMIDRGDLIAVGADALWSMHGDARIETITTSGGNVTGLTLTNDLPLTKIADDFFGPTDMFAPTDFFTPGNGCGVTLMYDKPGQQVVTHLIDETADTNVITFTTPFTTPTNLLVGSPAIAGPAGIEHRRLYVEQKSGGPDGTTKLLCIPEANSLVA